MKAISVRRGFATNSSSSHSIIFSANPNDFPEGMADYGEFGWNYFVQKTQQEKMSYIYQAFSGNFDSNEEMAEYFGVPVEMVDAVVYDGYIDHDSYGLFDMQTAKSILHNDKLAILGGNDNQEDPSWVKSFQKIDRGVISDLHSRYEKFLESGERRQVIHDYSGSIAIEKGVMTHFNKHTGVKVRYNMEDESEVYLSVPELVDIKITDYCPYGCSYCYQNSTEAGLHADFNKLVGMIEYMRKEGVFELAIGGGEPTLHPDFHKIIEACAGDKKDDAIVPNFTTRNLSVFRKGADKTFNLLNSIGGFAFSVDGPKDVKKFRTVVLYWIKKAHQLVERMIEDPRTCNKNRMKVRDYMTIARLLVDKVSIQLVLGGMSRDTYKESISRFNDDLKIIYKAHYDFVRAVEAYNKEAKFYSRKIYEAEKNGDTVTLEKYAEYKDIDHIFFWGWDQEELNPTIMLLGYKTTGRGSNPEYDYINNALDDVINISDRKFSIGIDTAAAQQMQEQINKRNVPSQFYYVKEGVASCYIDAVQETMASSSYCPEAENNSMDDYSNETFVDNFNKYQKQGLNAIPLNIVA